MLFLGNIVCFAQDRKNSEPTALVLEITFHKENKPAYQTVFENTTQAKGSWFALFQRVPNWRQPEGSLPVRAVNVVSRLENETVKVRISVFTGQKLHEKEEFVADYTMRENDKITVGDLTKFGVEPFEIAVVRLTPAASVLPRVENKSNSVTVAGLETVYSTMPSYKLTLANNSEKAVSAISFRVSVDGRMRLSGMPQGAAGRPLIESGKQFEKIIPNSTELVKVPAGQPIPVQANQTLTIAAVIFEDDSFEGDEAEAARFLAFKFGRQLQLKRIVALLRQTAENDSAFGELGKQSANLSVEIDDNDFAEFTNKFAGLSDDEKFLLRSCINSALQGVKREFVSDVENLTGGRGKVEAAETRNWLNNNKVKYQNWLLRLD